ncbi:MAG: MFS transporter [Betaproteobacteria bacterium]|nr:MFS transporter [Betaproteobacteria bacterium]
MPEADADAQPARRWSLVAALGVTQIVSWGSVYYAYAVVMGEVARDLGVSSPTVVGAYCGALLVSGIVAAPVGRHIDRHGARAPMVAGSVLAAALLAGFSQVSAVWALYATWAGLGFAMGLVLYEPAFASLALVFRQGLRKAITVLTLAGGLASTVFWPLTQWLESSFGWRDAMLVLAAINLVVCVPLHAIFLPRGGAPRTNRAARPTIRRAARSCWRTGTSARSRSPSRSTCSRSRASRSTCSRCWPRRASRPSARRSSAPWSVRCRWPGAWWSSRSRSTRRRRR